MTGIVYALRFFTFISLVFIPFVRSSRDSMNFILNSQGRECFYEDIVESDNPKIIDVFIPSGGNVNIILEIFGPLSVSQIRKEDFGSPILTFNINAMEEEESETHSFNYAFDPDSPGSYAICTDNRLSRFTPKRVEFDITSREKGIVLKKEISLNEDAEVNAKLKESIHKIGVGLNDLQLQQHKDRNRQSLHTAINQNSHNGVMVSSLAETVAFLISSLFQIFFVRRWFLAKTVQAKQPKQWA